VERQDPLTAGRWTLVTLTASTSFSDPSLGTGVTVGYRVTPLRNRWIGVTAPVVSATTPSATSFAGC
jgi:hypothetical protein